MVEMDATDRGMPAIAEKEQSVGQLSTTHCMARPPGSDQTV